MQRRDRIAMMTALWQYEYAFIAARQFTTWDTGHAIIPMSKFAVIYVKRTEKTPKTTAITFIFPDGQTVDYVSDNVILAEFTKERIVEKRLFPYIMYGRNKRRNPGKSLNNNWEIMRLLSCHYSV